jgi:hypothetical protein
MWISLAVGVKTGKKYAVISLTQRIPLFVGYLSIRQSVRISLKQWSARKHAKTALSGQIFVIDYY